MTIMELFHEGEFNPQNDMSSDMFDLFWVWSNFPGWRESYNPDNEVTSVTFVTPMGEVLVQRYKSRPYINRFDLGGRPITEEEFDKLLQHGVCLQDGLI